MKQRYTVECRKCQRQEDVFIGMDEIAQYRKRCGKNCRGTMRRVYAPATILPDTLRNPENLTTLRNPYDDGKVYPTAHSRSDVKRIVRDHDRRFGTRLEEA